ncbi:phosphatidylserine decarboxylase-domain-containing protein [Syncephalis plumigaleata]|nr:phosphatidylserine decarboxylase-domain-containing protein [Syncephalis plumigaleata]
MPLQPASQTVESDPRRIAESTEEEVQYMNRFLSMVDSKETAKSKPFYREVIRNLFQDNGNYVYNPAKVDKEYERMPPTVKILLATNWAVRYALQWLTGYTTYDKESSVSFIKKFSKMYKLDKNPADVDSMNSYKFRTFNQFFYRPYNLAKFRPIEEPSNTKLLSSAADCRLITFPTIKKATEVWIKGRKFTLNGLLGLHPLADSGFVKPALAVFRLAPQDYHRFHSPVDAKITAIKPLNGDYFTVNPIAVRRDVNVFTENKRIVVEMTRINPITGDVIMAKKHTVDSNGLIVQKLLPERVMYVCVGATGVGGIHLKHRNDADPANAEVGSDLKVGDTVKRGDQIGFFGFGGSSIVMIADNLKFNPDLVERSEKAKLETLVKVGSIIGQFTTG